MASLASRPPGRPLALVLLSALLAWGCSATMQPRIAAEEVAAGPPSLESLFDLLARKEAALSSFRGQARLRFRSPERKFRSTQMIAVRSPDRIRIDVTNPFGISYSVASDGVQLRAYDRREAALYFGPVNKDNIARLTGFAFEAPVLASLLRGLPPELGQYALGTLQWEQGAWLWRRPLRGGGYYTLAFDAATMDPAALAVTGPQGPLLYVRFSDYRAVKGERVAHKIEFELPGDQHAELIYGTIWRDVVLSDDAFTIEASPSLRMIRLDAGSEGGDGAR